MWRVRWPQYRPQPLIISAFISARAAANPHGEFNHLHRKIASPPQCDEWVTVLHDYKWCAAAGARLPLDVGENGTVMDMMRVVGHEARSQAGKGWRLTQGEVDALFFFFLQVYQFVLFFLNMSQPSVCVCVIHSLQGVLWQIIKKKKQFCLVKRLKIKDLLLNIIFQCLKRFNNISKKHYNSR